MNHSISRKTTGFTLIEMVIVILVASVLSAVAVPRFISWRSNMYVKSAARDLYSAMQEARLKAINQNKDISIVFDTTNSRYYLCDDPGIDNNWTGTDDSTGTGDNNIVQTYDLSVYSSVRYGPGTITGNNSVSGTTIPADAISYTNDVVTFGSNGISNGGYVYLQNDDGSKVYAVGTQVNGLIRSLKWDGGGWQ